jgi:hypothetical protein
MVANTGSVTDAFVQTGGNRVDPSALGSFFDFQCSVRPECHLTLRPHLDWVINSSSSPGERDPAVDAVPRAVLDLHQTRR